MRLRKILVQVFYGYLLLAVTVFFFLVISSFNNLFDGGASQHYLYTGMDKTDRVESMMYVGLLLFQLTGLLVVIVFKRKQPDMGNGLFILVSLSFFVIFILPTLLGLIMALSSITIDT